MFSTLPHKSIPVGLPIFCISFEQLNSSDRDDGYLRLYAGGGGGPNRSGVKNAVVSYTGMISLSLFEPDITIILYH